MNNLLELPDWVFPVAGMCVGYPATNGHLNYRLPLEVTVHTDTFGESDFEEQLNAYDERRAAAMPEAERYLWSEATAKQSAVPPRPAFGTYVRRKGFRLT